MSHVTLAAPTPGLNKVRLTKALQVDLGLTLSAAKGVTDRVAGGETVTVAVADRAAAERFVRSAIEVGAAAEVSEQPVRSAG
jgi:hypothetical protein